MVLFLEVTHLFRYSGEYGHSLHVVEALKVDVQ